MLNCLCDEPAAAEPVSVSDRRTRKMNILNIPWEKPSEEKAKKYAVC